MVNNKINSDFYKYYLKNNLNIQIEPNNNIFDYKVVVLDHNVNIIELTPNDELIIKENDYEIINKLVEEETKEQETKEEEEETKEDETINILENINYINSEDYITLEIPK
jgi:phosphoenolpyruvate-protein kinase (PTS system EI component)